MSDIYEFTLYDRTGKAYPLSDYRGRVMLIVNTATGCGFTPHYEPIEKMYEKYHDKGFEIYGVSLDDDGEAWKATIERQGMKWVNVSELKGWQTPAAQEYSVNAIPANFLIGEDGKIIAKDLRGEDLVALLAEIFE